MLHGAAVADCCGTARQFDGTIDAYQQSPFHGCGNLWNHGQRRCVRIKGPVYSGPYCFLPSLSFCGFDLNSRHTSKTKLAIVAIAARANRIFSNMALLLSLEALPASDFAGTHKEYQKAKEKHVLCYVRNCKKISDNITDGKGGLPKGAFSFGSRCKIMTLII